MFKALSLLTQAVSDDFMEHVAMHGLSYGTQEEYAFRQQIFLAKDAEYKQINADKSNTFTVGHNFLSTWTKEEYAKLLGYKGEAESTAEPTVLDVQGTPTAVDWRDHGMVNPVKNQGQCGSCWAFSATSSIESQLRIQHKGPLHDLSEQQVVSCDTDCAGCGGGWQAKAMEYVAANGQHLTKQLPYTAGNGQAGACPTKIKGHARAFVDKVNTVTPKSAAQLKAAIAGGPTSVTVCATAGVFQGYTTGVVNSASCGTQLDHAITAVGYGNDGTQDFYIVRNSWTANWGDKGYIKIAAVEGTVGICGIQQTSVWPTMKADAHPHPKPHTN